MDKIIFPGAVEGEIEPPSSKSYAQRAIAATFLSGGQFEIDQQECADTAAALRVVEALRSGADVLNIGESGLATRLFTPIAAMLGRPITITGHGSILKRPMTMMIAPLRELGVEVTDNDGFLPITVHGPMRGGRNADGESTGESSGTERGEVAQGDRVIEIDGSVSSQFLTGLLMALPLAAEDTTIRVRDLKSIPYINMTLDVMDAFGIDVDHRDYEEFYVPGGQQYTPCDYPIEGDWSAASCLLVAGAVAGCVTVQNLRATSLQADAAIIEALSRAGARIEQDANSVRVSRPVSGLHSFEFDATDCPDLFPALAALAACCEGTSTITGTGRLIHKESNRAEAIHSELGKLGVWVDISEENVMRIAGGGNGRGNSSGNGRSDSTENSSQDEPVEVSSHGDHRIAMMLAVVALNASTPLRITGAECVSKSYSAFWQDFEKLRIKR